MVKNPPDMQEMLVPFQGWEDPLEKDLAAYSSILVWKIDSPRGPKTVRHELATTTRASPPCYKGQCLQGLAVCSNKIPDWVAPNQQKWASHSSGGWKFELKVLAGSGSGEDLLRVAACHFCCVLTW